MAGSPCLVLDSAGPRVVVNEQDVLSAPTVSELESILGPASRLYTGDGPAPVGHHDNVVHVFDDAGLTLNEHHYTRRIQEISCYFTTEDPDFPFTPSGPFTGAIVIDGVHMPTDTPCVAFVERCPLPLEQGLAGMWSWKRAGFSIHLSSRGPRLRSGRRGKTKLLVSISISWPHDPWLAIETSPSPD